ncbi:MAG: type II toxin-antitoxin system HicB family antitoxin [Planctomycetota bacterium]
MVAPKILHHEFNAVLEPPTEDDRWWIAYSPELPGANGQGESEEEALEDLKHAIELVLQTRLEEGLRGVPDTAKSARVTLG